MSVYHMATVEELTHLAGIIVETQVCKWADVCVSYGYGDGNSTLKINQ